MVEIAPGVYAPLRGSHETWRAIQRDFYRPTTCVVCGCGGGGSGSGTDGDATTLFVIQDASYVLCPICRVVGPVEPDPDSSGGGGGGAAKAGGVGLGFTHEDLVTWITTSSSSSSRR